MLNWLVENMGTIIISCLLIGIVAMVIRVLIRDKRKGKSACGGNCGHCPMNCSSRHHHLSKGL